MPDAYILYDADAETLIPHPKQSDLLICMHLTKMATQSKKARRIAWGGVCMLIVIKTIQTPHVHATASGKRTYLASPAIGMTLRSICEDEAQELPAWQTFVPSGDDLG